MSAFQKFLFVCLILSLCSFSFAGSLVGHWKLDEPNGTVAYDSAGANNGTVSGAIWTAGAIDGGLDFDGIDDKVIIPDSDVLTPANTMTVSYWVYNMGHGAFVGKYASCPSEPASPGWSRAYILGVSGTDNTARLSIFASPDSYDHLDSIGAVSLNQWHLITGTFNNGEAKIYIDGVLDSSKTMTVTSIMNDVQPFTIGGVWNYCGTDEWFGNEGIMDDVRLYDYALSDAEVAALYNQSPMPALVAHWKFDETSGNIASDSVGTNNGTVSGALWTAGAIDGGLDFDGSGNYVLGTNSPFNFENTTFSVGAWFKTTESDFSVIVSEGGYGNGGWVLGVNGYVYFIIKSSNFTDDACYVMTTGSYNDGQWHHVAAIATTNTSNNAGNNVVFYIDGNPAAATESDTRSAYGYKSSITNWSIGARDGATRTFFDGSIDDVRIYNYGISDAEVAALYGQAPQSGLVGHWKLDEISGNVAYDSAGTNNGTVFGALWTAGAIDGGLDFDGIDDKVIIPDSDVLTPTDAMTLSCWIYNRGGQSASIYKWASCPDESASPGNSRSYGFGISGDTGKVNFNVHSSVSQAENFTSVGTVPYNEWHLITVTFDMGEAKMYIDGVLDNSKTLTAKSIINDAQPLTFGGCWNYCGTDYWFARLNGVFDDVRLYDYALSDAEVAALYGQAPLPHVATTYHVATTGLDINAGTSQAAAFATIQKGIDAAVDGDTVVVWPGTYDQQANFNGKAITVKSADAEPAVISNSAIGYAFVFENGEEPNSVLQNFIISNGCFAVYTSGSSPTIKNLTIVDNYFGIDAYDDAVPAVSNCIFLNNRFGDIEGADTQYSWPFDLTAVACWSFEETTGTKVYDGIGSSDGVITGATREPNGLLGRAMSFDGNGDYITVPSSGNLDITGDITIAAWVKPTNFSSSVRYIAIKPYAYELGIRNTNPTFRLSSGTKDRSYPIVEKTFTDLAFVLNQWNYIVVKREGALVKAWLNGKESAQPANVSPTAAIALSSYPFSIGTVVVSSPYPYYYFVGQIDEVALFDRALSIKEIENYYELTQSGYYYTDPMMADSDNGDYHLLSEFGRYDANSDQWILDEITSPCVDAGDPTDNPMGEPMPNGGRINIGAYGGIGHASKGGEWPLPFDFNTDGIVNMADFAKLAEHWLDKLPWVE